MIKFSARQFAAIEDQALYNFARRISSALQDYTAPLTADKSDDVLFDVAHHAIEKADSYGVTIERSLFQYANLAVMLGAEFDRDPGLPWARSLLGKQNYLSGNERFDDLWNTSIAFIDTVFDKAGDVIPRGAYERYQIAAPVPKGLGEQSKGVLDDLEWLWPKKLETLGADIVMDGMIAASKRARAWGLEQLSAQWRFARIAFLTSTHFDADPLHGWAIKVLEQNSPDIERSAALEEAFEKNVIAPALRALELEELEGSS